MQRPLATALLIFCALPAGAADVSGRWSGFPGSFVLKQEGTALSGSWVQSVSEQYPFENGRVDGDRLSFTLGKYQADLRLEGEQIQGTISKGGVESVKVFLKRVDESAGPRAFEVASLKPATPLSGGGVQSHSRVDPGRLAFTNRTLKKLILDAYHLKDYQVIGPEWLNSEGYDVVATFPAATPREDLQQMIQSLLADRFKLKVHRESRELPVYALVVEKSGPKAHAVDPFDSNGIRMSAGPKRRQLGGNISFNQLADGLGESMDRPVLNFTAIKGVFEVKLEWTPDDDPTDGQTIYEALHQLGLKLESRKAPVEILVVDHAEKIPLEN